MEPSNCPYCQEPLDKPASGEFIACPGCGYRFARVGSGTDACLIIDSRLPDLVTKYKELSQTEGVSAILIDRRVSYEPIAGDDRRR